jgi:hypothetical protein
VAQYGELFDFDDDGTPVTLSDIEALYEKYGQTGSESTGVASETGEGQTVTTQVRSSTTTGETNR